MIKSLEEQRSIGVRAASAYNAYLKDVIDSELELLKESILETEDVAKMKVLIEQIKAWKAVGLRVQTDIESGRMAEITLNKEKD